MVVIVLLVLAIGFAIYSSEKPLDIATTTIEIATSTSTGTLATSTIATTTTKGIPVTKVPSTAKMSASKFQLFVAAGYCTKVAHSSSLEGYRAVDFGKTTIAVGQDAWKCADGNYYTN